LFAKTGSGQNRKDRLAKRVSFLCIFLRVQGNMGKAEQALFVLRNCYGGMIAMGATTFWETFPHAPEYISGDVPWALNGTCLLRPMMLVSKTGRPIPIEFESWDRS